MTGYAHWVSLHPFLSAAVQFGILGTLGEVLAATLRRRRPALPCTPLELGAKVLAWALLGMVIKVGFAGMIGFTEALLDHHILPAALASGVGKAFAISTCTNVLFGPQMMAFHRVEDNLILRRSGFDGLTTAWWTLLWFWIPAHTLTFSLPPDYRLGLAAVWSVVLGVILGLSRTRAPASAVAPAPAA